MRTLMNDVITALSAIPELNWVDDDLGQLNQATPAVEYPCALVCVSEGSEKYGELILEITIACQVADTTDLPPVKVHPLAENIYNLIKKTDQALQHLEGEQYGPLSRTKISTNRSYYPARFTLSYSTVSYE